MNMCIAYKIESIPIKIHLFRAVEEREDQFLKKDGVKNTPNPPKLGWENYRFPAGLNVIPVSGDHNSMR